MFRPWEDRWSAPWLRSMIFLPIALLQMLNLFWYFLILRIMFRYVYIICRCLRLVTRQGLSAVHCTAASLGPVLTASTVVTGNVADERSDGEDEDEDPKKER